VDAGEAAAPLACPPAALSSWQPTAYHHASAAQPAACTAALIADFYTSCLGPAASPAACNPAWGSGEDSVHQTCQSCLVTPESAATWGSLVAFGSTVSLNVAGCIELLDPGATGVACATSVQEADECEHQACDATCPVTDDASFADWRACVSASAAGVCARYTGPASCATSLAGGVDGGQGGEGGQTGQSDAGPALRCVNGASFGDQFTAIAAVFCGP
jgi:hypothetical protein